MNASWITHEAFWLCLLTSNVYSLATVCPRSVVQRSKCRHHDTRNAQQQGSQRHIPGHMTWYNKRPGCLGRLRISFGRVLVVTGLCISSLCLGAKFVHEQLFVHVYIFHLPSPPPCLYSSSVFAWLGSRPRYLPRPIRSVVSVTSPELIGHEGRGETLKGTRKRR